MEALYNLRDMLCEQLIEYGEKGELTNAVLEKTDMLAHAVKNLDKVIEKCMEEEDPEYSGNYGMRSYRRGRGSSRSSGMRGSSRRSYSSRYSGDDHDEKEDFVDQLYSMMECTEDEKTRQDLQNLASKMSRKR